MRILISTLCLLLATALSAEVYRSVDEEGNVVYTDQASPDAEVIQVDELQTISPPAPSRAFKYEKKSEKAKKYSQISITSPQHDMAIRDNSGSVTVSVSVTPVLGLGHSLVLYFDGKESLLGAATSKTFTNVDRGSHQLRAAVKNAEGRILISSKSVTFHLQRQSLNRPNRAN
ncbi:MAG: DUF4124 domain-containing protein [Gammaproteobacteria bacterium]|nr:DUF4124 domain-containing protein [Gammaproteobacteria bacterium]